MTDRHTEDMRYDLPVDFLPQEQSLATGEDGVALCLSGGGYRAMIFHVGALWRLYEVDRLGTVARVSSVSGGSITAGVLALAWRQLSFEGANTRSDFVREVVNPIRHLARRTIDRASILRGLFLPGGIADKVARAYDRHLFNGVTLQDLPDEPRFVFNATNVQSGALWRFSKPYLRDWRVGEIKSSTVTLARAVAASSAFPPVLSPLKLSLDPESFTPDSGSGLQHEPYTRRAVLSDGGVYDNLGLETAFKRYKTVLVSDGGGRLAPEGSPKNNWAQHTIRVLGLIDNQVRSLRKRQLISAFRSHLREGAYWSTWTDILDYGVPTPLECPYKNTLKLAELPTRLKAMPDDTQERLINWGYAVCDAALRAYVDPSLPAATDFPYPNVGV